MPRVGHQARQVMYDSCIRICLRMSSMFPICTFFFQTAYDCELLNIMISLMQTLQCVQQAEAKKRKQAEALEKRKRMAAIKSVCHNGGGGGEGSDGGDFGDGDGGGDICPCIISIGTIHHNIVPRYRRSKNLKGKSNKSKKKKEIVPEVCVCAFVRACVIVIV